jgi:hypothetical protein
MREQSKELKKKAERMGKLLRDAGLKTAMAKLLSESTQINALQSKGPVGVVGGWWY